MARPESSEAEISTQEFLVQTATATSEMAKRAEQVHAMIQGSGHALQETERSLQAVNDRANQLGQLVGRFRL